MTDAGIVAGRLASAISSVVLSQAGAVRLAVAATVAGGHVLVEGPPGVGKTLLGKALARAIGGSFGRVQGTPDLLPADLTGVTVYDQSNGAWVFRPGPLFHHVVLVDELNRSTPRTQSALLEAMAESQITVDGVRHHLPDPFVVIATQNPHGDAGTFPLVAGQRDRFAVVVSLDLPGREAERELLTGSGGTPALERLEPVCTVDELVEARRSIEDVHVALAVVDYVLEVADRVRARPEAGGSVSTRACQVLLAVARALAAMDGRGYVTPDDVQEAAASVLPHRIELAAHAPLQAARSLVAEVLEHVPVPVG